MNASSDSVISLPVEGMTCAACATRVQRRLSELPGVINATVNYATESATVEHSGLHSETLVSTVEKAGYGVHTLVAETILSGTDAASRASSLAEELRGWPGIVHVESIPEDSSEDILVRVRYIRDAIDTRMLGSAFSASQGQHSHVASAAAVLDDIERRENNVYRATRNRFIVAALLSGPVVGLSMRPDLIGSINSQLLLFALATIVVGYSGWTFFYRAYKAIRLGSADMNTLVSMGVGSAYTYSTGVVFFPGYFERVTGASAVYFEAATIIITLVLFGRLLEQRAKRKTGLAIRALLKLQPASARVEKDGKTVMIAVEDLTLGDIVHVFPGEKVPADGTIRDGSTEIDESMLSGESMPSHRSSGDKVWGGTQNTTGAFALVVTRLGEDTMVAQIVRSVQRAQASKAPVQDLADSISAVFVPIVLLIAIIASAVWLLVGPEPVVNNALLRFVTVLIIACPCALGLATPTAIVVGTGRAANHGILLRDGSVFQGCARLTTVVLDKTGTLTEGKPEVVGIESAQGYTAADVVRIAATLEQKSEHPLARAIMAADKDHAYGVSKQFRPDSFHVTEVRAIPGSGILGLVDGREVRVGNAAFLGDNMSESAIPAAPEAWSESGFTSVIVTHDDHFIGHIAIADRPRDDAKQGIAALRKLGLKIMMITGDQESAARFIAGSLGIDEVYFGIAPDGKRQIVKSLQEGGDVVAMVGDGINDAPALAQADIGIAMGSGSDIAVEAGDITVMHSDVKTVAEAIRFARLTLRVIYQNLAFAFVYNVILIPVAAGVLYPLAGITLSPVMASAAMAMSSVSVVANSLRLKRL